MQRAILTVLLYAVVLPVSAAPRPRDVILTTDCGTEIDDQWAIVYLLLSPGLNVKGVVTTHAPNLAEPRSQTSAACARAALRRLEITSPPPVFAGSSVPLRERQPLRNRGVDFMVETSRAYSPKNRLVILTIGATTDVASALLADPTLGDRIEILTMGFNSWPRGTDDWNIRNDPLAYSVILESQAPVTIGAGDVCRAHLKLSGTAANELLRGHGAVAEWLADLFQDWITRNAESVAQAVGPQQWVIWDTIVVARLLGYTSSRRYPRPGLNTTDLTFLSGKTRRTIGWITAVDETRMWADFIAKLDKHRVSLAKPPGVTH